MSIKRQIPEIEGIQDKKATDVLRAQKAIIEGVTGRLPGVLPIVTLGASATLSGVINKVNEIIKRLQDEG